MGWLIFREKVFSEKIIRDKPFGESLCFGPSDISLGNGWTCIGRLNVDLRLALGRIRRFSRS